jgi:uncharacterized membrane protein YphA (DoxX/SURF4 family)
MYPSGIAGLGLLILRFAVAAMFVESTFATGDPAGVSIKTVLTIASACLLCLGMFTPAACFLPIAFEAASIPQLNGVAAATATLFTVVTASLLMLGPGAYSIDSRLFGPRIVVLPGKEL